MSVDSPSSVQNVVEKYLKFFEAKDYAAVRSLLHDNLCFKGPLEIFERADDFVAAIKRLQPIHKSNELKRLFVDGNDVCAIYDFTTHLPQMGTLPIAEWFHVRDGRIQAIRLFFDPRPFAAASATAQSS